MFESGTARPAKPAVDIVRESLEQPIGAPRLREMARGLKRVLIIPDDVTRLTPAYQIVPHILDELHAAGVRDEGISFLMGLGTHREHDG